jgi:hypothetical protein
MQGLQVEGVYRQGMAPASASPQPPSDRPERVGLGGRESRAAHRGKPDQGGHAEERYEAYGPLNVERQVKRDGRALILYARLESPGR